MNITFIGIGQVGRALATAVSRVGHTVSIAARDPDSDKVRAVRDERPDWDVMEPAAALSEADLLFLAVPFAAAAEALAPYAKALSGRIVVDCTNPVGRELSHGLESKQSGSEVVQAAIPAAHVVKAFTVYGFENLADATYPGYGNLLPMMPLAGDDVEAKATVGALCSELGWEPLDIGPLRNALHLEHMTLLWIKMARAQGHGPDFVWARLRR